MRKKVLFVHERGGIGGAGKILYTLLAHMDRGKFEPVVVLGSDGELVNKIRKLGLKCIICPMPEFASLRYGSSICRFLVSFSGNIVLIAKTAFRLFPIVYKERPDIIYANSLQAQLASSFVAKLFKKPLVWHVHNIQPAGFRQRMFKMMVRLLPDKVIVVSKAVKDNVEEPCQTLSKVHLVYNGIETEAFTSLKEIYNNIRNEFNIPNEYKVITMVSALRPWKGHVDFLKAARLVIKQFPKCKFLLVGDVILRREQKYKHDLIGLTAKLSIEKHVIFTGFREDVMSIMSQSDIIVLPSIQPDPFPTVILEAMAMAKPVVATKIGGIPEMVEHGKTGLLVPPQNPELLAAAIIRLLVDANYADQLGQSGFARLKEMFGMDKFIAGVENVLAEVSGKGIC